MKTFFLSLSWARVTIIIIIIIKKDWEYKAGRGRFTPYQSEDPNPTLPTYRGKAEKGKIVEDKKGESNYSNKRALDLLLKPANPTPSNTVIPLLLIPLLLILFLLLIIVIIITILMNNIL